MNKLNKWQATRISYPKKVQIVIDMRKCLCLIVISVNISCISREKKAVDITGNWYNYENAIKKEVIYTETFINKKCFSFYNNEAGYFGSQDYMTIKHLLYNINLSGEKIKSGRIELIDRNTFKIVRDDESYLIFKRIRDSINLEKFLNKTIDEDTYWEAFNKRRLVWKNR